MLQLAGQHGADAGHHLRRGPALGQRLVADREVIAAQAQRNRLALPAGRARPGVIERDDAALAVDRHDLAGHRGQHGAVLILEPAEPDLGPAPMDRMGVDARQHLEPRHELRGEGVRALDVAEAHAAEHLVADPQR